MILRPPTPLGLEHDAAAFDCGVRALDGWLRRQGPAAAGAPAATFVVAKADGRVVAFYTLAAGSVRSAEVSPLSPRGTPVPVLKLGRLAVDRSVQGRGIGTALVVDAFERTYALSRRTPVAALMVDELASHGGWLSGMGFQPVPGNATTQSVPVGKIEALVQVGRR